MSGATPTGTGPVLVCHDGSDEALHGVELVAALLGPAEIVVLAVWQSASTKLALSASFGALAVDEHETLDVAERAAAGAAAEQAVARARGAGHTASSRVEEARGEIWPAILAVADEMEAALIVTGTRGRGSVKRALLGSVSHDVLDHAERPVLIVPAARS
jgi:nucleotide-binding universal stress UspA family protein